MTFIAQEIRLCWQAVSELRACAVDQASEEERRLRRDEVEAIALLTDRPEIKRRCEDALRSTGLHSLKAEAGSSVIPLSDAHPTEMDQDSPDDPAVAAIQRLSQVYEPIAVLRQGSAVLIVARIGMKAARRFTILNADGEPAWPHEALGSLSDVAWALQAHGWQQAPVEPAGGQPRPAKTLAALLKDRA